MPFDPQFLYIILLIVYLESVLSIDNAAVLGAMVTRLPANEAIPWPRSLGFLSHFAQRLLGGQRSAALKVGLAGAYLGRAGMLLLANFVIQNPWLKVLGGLYLIKLAFENLGEAEPGEQTQVDLERVMRKGFWNVVLAVELADLAFSLDNVVTVVALSDDIRLVMFGVAVGILMMRFAAGIFTTLILKEPVLKPAAYIVVMNIGVELLLEELFHTEVSEVATFIISGATLLLAIVYAHVKPLQNIRPVFRWLAQGMGNLNEIADWLLKPIYYLILLPFRGLVALVRSARWD